MRIAVPSDDQSSIAPFFGRSRGFLVYDVADDKVSGSVYRPAKHETKTKCRCTSTERSWRHQAVLDAITGCTTVIARGMGAQMYDDLLSCGLEVFLTDTTDARTAVEQLLAHALPERAALGCAGGE